MSFTVAIDGPAAAGKGTIARAVAHHFDLKYLDTGLLYRAVGKKALAYKVTSYYPEVATQLAKELRPEDLDADDLRTIRVAQAASKIAAIPQVREVLKEFQREFAKRDGGAVLDGRDIGTVICPDADAKLFVTASDEVRAERRFQELKETDDSLTFETVLEALKKRDQQDQERAAAPLKQAEDAFLLDTSELSISEAISTAIEFIESKK